MNWTAIGAIGEIPRRGGRDHHTHLPCPAGSTEHPGHPTVHLALDRVGCPRLESAPSCRPRTRLDLPGGNGGSRRSWTRRSRRGSSSCASRCSACSRTRTTSTRRARWTRTCGRDTRRSTLPTRRPPASRPTGRIGSRPSGRNSRGSSTGTGPIGPDVGSVEQGRRVTWEADRDRSYGPRTVDRAWHGCLPPPTR